MIEGESHGTDNAPPRRLASVLIVALCLCTLACGAKEVTTAATEHEALEMVSVLHDNGFRVSKEAVGEGAAMRYSVRVEQEWFGEDSVLLATQVLRDNGLPRPPAIGGEGAYKDQGFVTPQSAQAAQRLKERETEIERQLYTLPNVVSAEVNIVLGEDSSINFKPYPASASVVIVHKDPKFALSVEEVQGMVAGSVPSLDPGKVAVALAQKEVRPVPRARTDARQTKLIYAIGAGLLIMLSVLAAVFMLQNRRQRRQLDRMRHDAADAPAGIDGGEQLDDATADGRWSNGEIAPDVDKKEQLAIR